MKRWGGLLIILGGLLVGASQYLQAEEVTSTQAYFSLTYTGGTSQTLVSLSATSIDQIQMLDATGLPIMEVEVHPHQRLDFTPGGLSLQLSGLAEPLEDGSSLNLTFNFATGEAFEVEFAVVQTAPEKRLNFTVLDDFQIASAWVYATTVPVSAQTASEDYQWNLPTGFTPPRVPDTNPMTTAKVELGRYLFYDPRLSRNENTPCASCHLQELAFTDGRQVGVGTTGQLHPRNSPTLTNTAYNATLTWANPTLLVLERQIPIPIFGEFPIELGLTGYEEEALSRFHQDTLYQELFAAAFPDEEKPITFANITKALASFIRTLISGNSPYDQYINGDRNALSESAQRGMKLFLSEGLECHHCHTGFNFSLATVTANSTFPDSAFFNTGLYNVDGEGAYPTNNQGIYEITGKANDMGRFRPPTLRNIALTAPYMHDGSVATLEEVIQFYMDGGRVIEEGAYAGDGRTNPYKSGLVAGFTLTDQEIQDLIAFLESLTDTEFITDPRFSDPFATQP
jgi:cytochrome c peroxidase